MKYTIKAINADNVVETIDTFEIEPDANPTFFFAVDAGPRWVSLEADGSTEIAFGQPVVLERPATPYTPNPDGDFDIYVRLPWQTEVRSSSTVRRVSCRFCDDNGIPETDDEPATDCPQCGQEPDRG